MVKKHEALSAIFAQIEKFNMESRLGKDIKDCTLLIFNLRNSNIFKMAS